MTARRREFLTAFVGLSAGMAGCLGDDDGDDLPAYATTDDSENADSDEERAVPNTDEYDFPPPGEPAEVPAEMGCPACNHTPADNPDVNAQVVHENGHREFFCTPGCFVAYREATGQYAVTDAAISAGWVRDVDSTSLHRVDGDTFHWVIDTSPDPWRGIDPMSNPLPYRDREAAVAYVDSWDDLSESDILRTGELDREIAREYRAVE